MAYPRRFRVEALRSLAFGGIGAAYAAVGAALANPARIVCFQNLTNRSVLVSINGVTDHFIIPALGFKLIDVTANEVRNDGYFLDVGTVVYVKQGPDGAPGSGTFYVECIYAG